VRIGINLLPELAWGVDRARWARAEQLGFDHAWTYDHLAWRTLADGPWHATVPTLTAAALVTSRIRLGALVTSPNFRHPVPLAKELMTLDVISEGRLNVAVGAGAEGHDSTMLGQPALTPRQRHERFVEFSGLLAALLASPRTDFHGDWYDADDARVIPGPAQQPRPPVLVAANGPRGMQLAVDSAKAPGDGWVTLGAVGGTPMSDEWWDTVEASVRKMDAVLADRDAPAGFVRLLYLSSRLTSAAALDDVRRHVERAGALGFTDVVLPWPRATEPFRGDERLLDDLGALLPELRATSR
jgi:alkanesulfonate monooxygenase SsuD/methylene tetrahydromethanopterin reductase-like flavin-dependent oxidoreductase (luciferase family)